MIEITSKENSHYKRWLDLDSSRGLKKHREFILMGEKLIHEYLKNPVYPIKAEIIHEDLRPLTVSSPGARTANKISLFKLPKALFNDVDVMGTHFNLLVIEMPEIPEYSVNIHSKPSGLEVLTPLGDPANLGALIRSAVAFNCSKIILSSEAANPFLPKAIKASAGAIFSAQLFKSPLEISELAEKCSYLWALDMKGESIHEFEWPSDMRLLIGEEGRGLPQVKMSRLSIPTGPVESLNATVAASLAFYSWNQYNTLSRVRK